MWFAVPLLLLASSPPLEDLVRAGSEALRSGDTAVAQKQFEAARDAAPSNPEVWLALVQVYRRTKQESNARASAERCIELAHAVPNWEREASILVYLARVQAALGASQEAIAEYREAVRLNPYDESSRFELAQQYLNREEFRAAVDSLEDTRKVFDKSPQIELALGVAYYGQRRFPDAIAAFLRTIELAPEVPQPYAFLGKMLDQAGSTLPAIEQRFHAYREAHPREALGYLLEAKAAKLNAQDAEPLLRRAIELQPDNWESRLELGTLLESKHAFQAAETELAASAKLNPDVAATHYHLARVYDRLDRKDAAREERANHQELLAHEKITAGMVTP